MCIECDDIEATIARYRRLGKHISDAQMREAANHLIAGLEAEKQALHSTEHSGHPSPSGDLSDHVADRGKYRPPS
jgi:hypothetical protein